MILGIFAMMMALGAIILAATAAGEIINWLVSRLERMRNKFLFGVDNK